MMLRLTSFLAVVVLGSGVAFGDIVSWHASSGVLPDDPSIPPESRFNFEGDPSHVSMQPGFMNINDPEDTPSVAFRKTDIVLANSWAYQADIRMNSHSGTVEPPWGAATGIRDEREGRILIATDRVGFAKDAFPTYQYAMNTTDDFHVFRVVKDSGVVRLFVDSFDTPVLTFPYNELTPISLEFVDLASTSNFRTADFDVRSFAYNPSGTAIPEPSSIILLATGAFGLLAYGWRKRRR